MTTRRYESDYSKLQKNKELNFLLNHNKRLWINL